MKLILLLLNFPQFFLHLYLHDSLLLSLLYLTGFFVGEHERFQKCVQYFESLTSYDEIQM